MEQQVDPALVAIVQGLIASECSAWTPTWQTAIGAGIGVVATVIVVGLLLWAAVASDCWECSLGRRPAGVTLRQQREPRARTRTTITGQQWPSRPPLQGRRNLV